MAAVTNSGPAERGEATAVNRGGRALGGEARRQYAYTLYLIDLRRIIILILWALMSWITTLM